MLKRKRTAAILLVLVAIVTSAYVFWDDGTVEPIAAISRTSVTSAVHSATTKVLVKKIDL